MMRRFWLPTALVAAAFGCQPQATPDQPLETSLPPAIEGAWRLASGQMESADGEITDAPAQESLFLFFDGFYSLAYSQGESPSPYYVDRFNPTDEERLSRTGLLTVNAGTFELTEGTLTTHPHFALNPGFVGGTAEYEYAISGNQLTLICTSVVSADGVHSPAFADGARRVHRLERVF